MEGGWGWWLEARRLGLKLRLEPCRLWLETTRLHTKTTLR